MYKFKNIKKKNKKESFDDPGIGYCNFALEGTREDVQNCWGNSAAIACPGNSVEASNYIQNNFRDENGDYINNGNDAF